MKIKILFICIVMSFCAKSQNQFHDTKGNIEVNGGGQLEYSLPIELPPGVKNVSPQINLVYTSGASNGIAGYGWNLSGLTSISRVGKTIDSNGEVQAVKLDYSDYYSFNGQRLILKSGEYGKNGAEYVTEKYSNIKIKSVGSVSGFAWNGPEYWEVTFENGSQAWYGATTLNSNSEARTPTEYNIVKWRDAQGNYITYNYSQNTSEKVALISGILWGGNDVLGKANFNSIDFTYVNRDLIEESYIKDLKFTQTKLLSEVQVKSNGSQFKKYTIEYIKNGSNYQFVNKVTEYNSQNTAANPVQFSYPNFVSSQMDLGVLSNNSDSFDQVKFTGDFNGDSYLDFVMNNGTVKLGAFDDAYSTIATNKVFSSDAKVVGTLIDEQGQIYNGNGIVQYENGYLCGYIFRNNVFIKIFNKLVYQNDCDDFALTCTTTAKIQNGDLDGDGIEDVFISLGRRVCYQGGGGEPPVPLESNAENRLPVGTQCYNYDLGNFIVDLKNADNPVLTYTLDFGINESLYTQQKYFDIDGDGKVDIINVSNSEYTVFEFTKVDSTSYLKKIKFSNSLAETKDPEYPILFGDFNGDGNLDFTIPVTNNQNQDNWRFYIGTQNGFQNTMKYNFIKYRKPNQTATLSVIDQHYYSISDINKDGKSDIVFIYSKNTVGSVGSSGNALWRNLHYDIQTLLSDGSSTNFVSGFSASSPTYGVTGGETGIFQPITNSIKSNNNYYDIFLFKDTRVHKYRAQTSLSELSKIKSITQGDVLTTVVYQELIPSSTSDFYKKTKPEYYPYFSLSRIDRSLAVSRLSQAGRKQDFRYRGMTGNMHGKGIFGFYQVARSSWYADGFESTKVWSGNEIDSYIEGLPVKQWTIRTNNESLIFPVDITENNSQLLSFASTTYQTDKLLDGVVTTVVNDTDKAKIVTAIVPISTKNKNFLTGVLTIGQTNYDSNYLPIQKTSNVNSGYATNTSVIEYQHNPSGIGSSYYVGRSISKTDLVQAYGDSKSSKEDYTYQDNLLKTVKKWNRDNSEFVLETYNYDGFGNVTQKVITNNLDSQTQISQSEYDSKGRFATKNTDNLGLETNNTYNNWGQLLTQTDPLSNTVTNTYDGWGKLTKSVKNLTGTTSYNYAKDNNSNIIVTTSKPDGNISIVYTNKIGQNYKSSTKAFAQGEYISKEIQYDVLGRKINESEPFHESQGVSQWNVISYDDSFFPAKVTLNSFNGKQTETFVSGNITTTNELNGYNRTTSKTNDAIGNVISSTDSGGTITFMYNAVGKQTKASYSGNVVQTKYDLWDRKSEFNDPSNGIYKYEYDGLGHPKKIISPKGNKQYSYNNVGQLLTENELSNDAVSTNKSITLSYDQYGRMTNKSGTSNGKSYSSSISYDQYGRVTSKMENSNGKQFANKEIVYDSISRVQSYKKSLISSGVTTQTVVKNVFSSWNGELYQIKDNSSQNVLWELQQANAKNQSLVQTLGVSTVTNVYDSFGLLSSTNHSSVVKPSVLQIAYSFDAIKNELNSRTTGGDFNIIETFNYDNNNRLTSWTNPRTGQNSSNSYDVRGRIFANDQVGNPKYETQGKLYRSSSIELNTNGIQNYTNDLLQTVSYNENNDPIYLDGVKGDVAFEYGLSSMRQRVTYGGNFSNNADGAFTKFYSEDGGFEIVKNNANNKEKHILYIAGNPYESNILFLKNYDDNTGSYKFLHKDYIGSILAVSDEAGNKLEQRHFDAWGNFTHLQLGSGLVINDKNIIDNSSLLVERGYTGHEHFFDVSIIHMNGRLYDPLLRRFLNADENIQEPFNTQNYNKYAYVMNNPLLYNDPSGELFSFLTAIFDTFRNVFSHGVNFDAYDYSRTSKAWKIDMGLFKGNFGQIVSRFTWESLQTIGGYLSSSAYNLVGGVKSVTYYDGATAVESYNRRWGGFTLGSFIIGHRGLQADPNNTLFQHEYGHYLQSQKFGVFYVQKFALPSLLDTMFGSNHKLHFAEQDANVRALTYFNKHVENYNGWDFTSDQANVIIGYNSSESFYSNGNQMALSQNLRRIKWYDPFLYFADGLLVSGVAAYFIN